MEKPGGPEGAPRHWKPEKPIKIGFDQTREGTARWRGRGAGARETAPRSPLLRRKMATEKNSPAHPTGFARAGRLSKSDKSDFDWIRGGRGAEELVLFLMPLFLQLPLQRLDFFGQRGIPGHQCLDLAHGVQHRGVVASAEPAADLGQ